MTGQDFKAAIEAAGLSQSEFAELMGVHRSVFTRVYKEKEVPPYWRYALGGVIASRMSNEIKYLTSLD